MNQKRTIMGSAQYCIETLRNLKRDMTQASIKNSEAIWAIGGIIFALNSNLLKIMDKVFNNSSHDRIFNAKEDLKEIQAKFNEFLEKLIEND